MPEIQSLDKLDKAILRCLQDNGRETYDVIGVQVGLSSSAVLRRVKRLEEAGVIDRYVALIQPEAVGLGHIDVEQDGASVERVGGVDQLGARGILAHLIAARRKQPRQRAAHRRVVVDQVDELAHVSCQDLDSSTKPSSERERAPTARCK